MVKARLKEASALRRKQNLTDEVRTARRDELADWIEAEFVNGEKDWQVWTMTDMAEEFGCSRQFVSDVLDAYFEPASSESDLPEILTPDVERDGTYKEGYRDGFLDGMRQAVENYDEFKTLFSNS